MARARRSLGFDQATAARWLSYVRTALWPYFRPQVLGSENLPVGRALVVGCHSGVIPYDAACTLVAIHEATGRFAYAVGDNLFGRIGLVEDFLRRQGALVGRPELVQAALRGDNLVLLFPGGAKDMERPYLTQRYRVLPHRGFAPGRGGYIKIALRMRAPIVPLAVVGAEEAHLMIANLPAVARALAAPLFPLVLFPFPLPVKLYIRFGGPIALPGSPADAGDQRKVDRLNEMVRRKVQGLIDDTVRRRRGVIFSSYQDERGGVSRPQRGRRRGRAARSSRQPKGR